MKACAHILDGLDGGFLLVLPRTHINKYRVAWAPERKSRDETPRVFSSLHFVSRKFKTLRFVSRIKADIRLVSNISISGLTAQIANGD